MNKVAIVLCAAALALTACASKDQYGDSRITDFKETPTTSPSPTVSQTKPTRKASTTPKPTKKKSNYKPTTYRISISNPYDSYQPNERVVREGDILIFTNKDPQNKHSLTEGAQEKENPAFDSGVKANGERWKWTVDVPPGEYMFHCEVVPYMQTAGPIKVLENPAL